MSAYDIADGAGHLVDLARASANKPGTAPPKVLLVAPAPLAQMGWIGEMFQGGTEKSKTLGKEYKRVADDRGIPFLDASTVVTSSTVDGIHLDKAGQRTRRGDRRHGAGDPRLTRYRRVAARSSTTAT